MDEALLERFVTSRLWIVEQQGYTLIGHNYRKTEKGFHFWFETLETLTDDEANVLQFLLGDDQPRVRYNSLRNEAGVFKDFNALFNKKLKRKRVIHECDERCIRLGYCPHYITPPDWCGRDPQHQKRDKRGEL